MSYLEDQDLEFLQFLTNQELQELYNVLVYDKDGDKRLTETLSTSDEVADYGENYSKYWQRIAEELQCLGANAFATLFRNGTGAFYKQILCNVCDRFKVNYDQKSSTENIEYHLLERVLEKTFDNMTRSERDAIAQSCEIEYSCHVTSTNLVEFFVKILSVGDIYSYKLVILIVNAVLKTFIGRSMMDVANNTFINRTMTLLNSGIRWTMLRLCTMAEVIEPAYRVTIPAVFMVIGLRQRYINRSLLMQENC
ncbi:hypothetical protein A6A19_03115 [Actinobacillus delphinicola]|uniref:DUF3944 domain-containing protein n=1 Tax=Actinobacillus delphinicola TaxID=51161 RepID=UPI0024411BB5|nr:DUF3944 domain-containing protein [Actinobacillus delphinicola]MDG6897014.1 hypothetical protein [Actinobacillus delphinicola]